MNLSELFLEFTHNHGFNQVERSHLISKYFKDEFNLSGGHSHLVPAVLSKEARPKENISVLDLCIRRTDAQLIGYSDSHLLLFEMGVWGAFGYIDNKKEEEFRQLSLLLKYLNICGIKNEDLYFTICNGGYFTDRHILPDIDSQCILLELGIDKSRIFKTQGRRNFMLSRGLDRLAGYNIEIFLKVNEQYIEIASSNIYEYINKITHLEKTINKGIGCGIGIERLRFVSEGLTSVYQLPFFKEAKEQIRKAMQISDESIEIIRDKIYRLIEVTKTLIFLLNDGQGFDKSPQGKAMKSYLAKIKSELNFLLISNQSFIDIMGQLFRDYYDKMNVDESSFQILLEEIVK